MLLLSLGVLLCSGVFAHASPGYLQPMKIHQTVDPIFPAALINSGVTTGACEIAIYVDPSGQLAEWLVTKYTDADFGAAAVAAIQRWKYEAAQLDGQPVGTMVDLSFNFEARGVVVSMTTLSEAIEHLGQQMRSGGYVYRPCGSEELDRAPEPTVTVTPQYPKELADKGVKGQVTVEYYIDETGAVRMPCVSRDDNPMLGGLTIAALSQWKFTPPTSHGRPVLVKARQVFDFKGDHS